MYKVGKVCAFGHPSIVRHASPAPFNGSNAFENTDVNRMSASVFVIQKFTRILFAQTDALVQ